MNTNDNTIYYKASEKIKSEWIDENAVMHEFENGIGKIFLKRGIIGDFAFCGCRSLKSIAIPDSVYRIGKYAFGRCSELTEVLMPKSVTFIDDRAFKDCDKLTYISFPKSL